MTRTIAVCGWEKFQHYKDRDPPWIKLYRDLLSSESWVLGTDASRLVQIASTLLAARYQNATPLNYNLFRKVASLDLSEKQFNEALTHLESYGFLEIQGDTNSASTVLATCTSETEGETEKRQSREEAEPDPSGLDAGAWAVWVSYRKEIKKPIKPVSMTAAKKAMAALGDQQRAAVEHTKANGWQGLIAPKVNGSRPLKTRFDQIMEQNRAVPDAEPLPAIGRIV
jgi:hypothetical protein